jgi:hypothetical protein
MHKPKSNKQKREQKLRKESERREKENRLKSSLAYRKAAAEARVQHQLSLLSKAGTRNPKETLKALYDSEKVTLPVTSPLWGYQDYFRTANRSTGDRDAMFRILSHAIDCGCDFSERTRNRRHFYNALTGLSFFHPFWLRPIEDWKPQSHNTYRQFSSLFRHLFAKYPVPAFFDNAWFNNVVPHQEWFIHVGEGHNIRTAKNLPLVLTSKMAHHMMHAPNDYEILAAMRWGQIQAMGGDERLVRGVLASRIGTVFANNDFWVSVIQWLMANPMLDTAQYAPIIDYLNHMKYVPSIPSGFGYVPEQPNLCMKKRSVEATIRGMEEWHKRNGRAQKGVNYWNPSGVPPFYYEEGETHKKIYNITELLSAKDLKDEGVSMVHCVASYASSCATGRVSIWSMTCQGERLLTIEVDNQSRTVRQARGKYNTRPTHKANDVMRRWAEQTGLTISRWLI